MIMLSRNYFVLAISFVIASTTNAQHIESKVACEWTNLRLDCKRGDILTILSANYGRTSSALCVYNGNTNCHTPGALDIVKNNCNGRQTCEVTASNTLFGDPCHGTEKYLEVKYTCSPAPSCAYGEFRCGDGKCLSNTTICNGMKECAGGDDERGCDYMSAYACEHSTLNVQCARGELIRVVYGHYGRTNPAICQWSNIENCRSPVAENILKDRCDFKQSCTVPASNGVFGDPCVGIVKYAELHYKCWLIPLK